MMVLSAGNRWIPAYAGMTVRGAALSMDSRLRGKDGRGKAAAAGFPRKGRINGFTIGLPGLPGRVGCPPLFLAQISRPGQFNQFPDKC